MAHYYIGDVQGCYDPLQRLLKKIRFDPASDRLIFCGDLVSRGGHSLEVLRLLYSIRKRVTVTLGNHDFNLLREDARFPSGMTRNGEFRQILQAPDRVDPKSFSHAGIIAQRLPTVSGRIDPGP